METEGKKKYLFTPITIQHVKKKCIFILLHSHQTGENKAFAFLFWKRINNYRFAMVPTAVFAIYLDLYEFSQSFILSV